jgi:hypothetical protein
MNTQACMNYYHNNRDMVNAAAWLTDHRGYTGFVCASVMPLVLSIAYYLQALEPFTLPATTLHFYVHSSHRVKPAFAVSTTDICSVVHVVRQSQVEAPGPWRYRCTVSIRVTCTIRRRTGSPSAKDAALRTFFPCSCSSIARWRRITTYVPGK